MGKAEVYERDGGRCFYCDKPLTREEATREHLLALVHGGPNTSANLTIACAVHNNDAGAKSIVEKVKLRDTLRPIQQIPAQPSSLLPITGAQIVLSQPTGLMITYPNKTTLSITGNEDSIKKIVEQLHGMTIGWYKDERIQ